MVGGKNDKLLHYWLEVHPEALDLAVRNEPSGFRYTLAGRALMWLQQQPVTKESGLVGSLRMDIGKMVVLVSRAAGSR
jgi:hypothetical protein